MTESSPKGRKKSDPSIRRILVALDASSHSLAALQAATQLAAAVQAELAGLFVEDINLLRLCSLSPASRVSSRFAGEERAELARMERALRLQGRQLERALAEAATRARVRWSFRTARGQVASELLSAALESDLLMVGRTSRAVTRRAKLGSTARALARQAPGAVLLIQHGLRIGKHLLVLYHGTPAARRALETALRLAEIQGSLLSLLVTANSKKELQELEEETGRRVAESKVRVRIRHLLRPTLENLATALRLAEDGLVVMAADISLPSPEDWEALLHQVDNPVLLVR